MKRSSSPQTWFTTISGVLMVIVLAGWISLNKASAQRDPSQGSVPPSTSKQSGRKAPSKQARKDFFKAMSRVALPGKGCFTAHYPNKTWQKVKCGKAPKYPNPVARGAHPNYVGAGNDYFIQVTGNVSSATGSFDSITGVSQEYGSKFGNVSTVSPDIYSLQLNANQFSTPVCGGVSGCTGWEQFLYSQSQCNGACIFIEYWLLNHTSPCPSGNSWTYYPGTPTTVPGCFLNTAYASVPVQTLSDFGNLKLSGTASGGTDTVMVSTANGNVVATAQDSILDLAQGWTGGEYNVVGDCCASEIFFNSGSNVTVRLSASNGTTNVPGCTTLFNGATAETNNLNLVGSCSTVGGASPAIVFSESGGGPLPPGVSVGDPHLTTFYGTHYDFQAAGEFVLVQSDPDLIVQTRQQPISPPSVAVNTGIGVNIGGNRVAVCPSGVEIFGFPVPFPDGKSVLLAGDVTLSRRGNVYVISRPSGDVIQAQVLGGYVDVSVTLGVTNTGNVRGLLGGQGGAHNLAMRDGTVLKNPISYDTWVRYANSWRVPPADSLLCSAARVPAEMPKRLMYAEDLDPKERDRARAICTHTGVRQAALLDDCTLDVSLLHKESAADVFVYAPRVKKVVRPKPPSASESQLKQ